MIMLMIMIKIVIMIMIIITIIVIMIIMIIMLIIVSITKFLIVIGSPHAYLSRNRPSDHVVIQLQVSDLNFL